MNTKYKDSCFFHVVLFAFCIFMGKVLFSQDIHFSNWQMSPLNLNPANAGMFDGDGRLIFNYRNQWKSVPVPYNTFSFGGDYNLKKSLIKKAVEAVGIIFNHDGSGDGKYKITDFKIPINHKFSFKKDSGLILVLAVILGMSGIDRFMLGDIGMGVLKLFTFGGCGILWIIDIFSAKSRTSDFNRKHANRIMRYRIYAQAAAIALILLYVTLRKYMGQ